ncbi:MAG: Stp1/IreP family PP2C-type Ser/Thr phosphatase [Candidatus Eisenbacteria bacterium]|nr:Stp1/IreP family PP2C-type Ser/Thr phosphatase [Candidatus Eisenbacteria bacterium]
MNEPQSSRPGDTLRFAVRSERGRVRAQNQDWAHAEAASERARHPHGRLFLVADGIGGHAAGEVASRLAVESILEAYYSNPLPAKEDPAPLLALAFETANAAILREARAHPEFRGMGTTCTAALVREDGLWVAHVGDSRGYLFRAGRLSQITVDHNVVAQLLREGRVTPEEAETHNMRHMLTRALGIALHERADVSPAPLELRAGDRLLLCSDGLSGVVPEKRIQAALGERTVEETVRSLVDEANELGGPDNITVVLVEVLAR